MRATPFILLLISLIFFGCSSGEMAELQQKSFNGFSNTTMTVGSYEKLLVQFENQVDKLIK